MTDAAPQQRVKSRTETYRGETYFRDDLLLYVNRVPEGFTSTPHDHDFLEFTYVVEGTGYHHIGGEVHPVRKGQLFFIPIGVPHVFRPSSADTKRQPLFVCNCLVHPSLFERLPLFLSDPDVRRFLASLADGGAGYFSLPEVGEAIGQLFDGLHREFAIAREGSADYMYALLVQLLISVYRAKRHPQKPESKKLDAFSAVLDYVERHLDGELTLARIALISRWSERHLQRLFLRHTEQSFHRYVQFRRMQKSCALLSGTQLSISAISERVGYRDVGSFLTVFKRTIGRTPGEYRRTHVSE
ncbi:helix-turn-helix domain-containing protein [Cohnella sp. GCM10027633]|uniref:helix-turn-helix domain-containing protein n=1 Tax=unclassified Cohnella TaxID=2636738 RepID=UPI003645A33B